MFGFLKIFGFGKKAETNRLNELARLEQERKLNSIRQKQLDYKRDRRVLDVAARLARQQTESIEQQARAQEFERQTHVHVVDYVASQRREEEIVRRSHLLDDFFIPTRSNELVGELAALIAYEVIETPRAPEPSFTPAPSYYSAPEPSYSSPEPSYSSPEPSYSNSDSSSSSSCD